MKIFECVPMLKNIANDVLSIMALSLRANEDVQ